MVGGDGHEVIELLATTTDVEIGLLIKCRLAEELIVPHDVGERIGIKPLLRPLDLVCRIGEVAGGEVAERLVVEVHIGDTVDKLRDTRRGIHIPLKADIDDRLVQVGSRLGGHDDDTIGSAGSVERCGGRILEDREALDHLRVKCVEVAC